jgi:hypothetical protein
MEVGAPGMSAAMQPMREMKAAVGPQGQSSQQIVPTAMTERPAPAGVGGSLSVMA